MQLFWCVFLCNKLRTYMAFPYPKLPLTSVYVAFRKRHRQQFWTSHYIFVLLLLYGLELLPLNLSLSGYPSCMLLFPKFLILQGKFETGTSDCCVLWLSMGKVKLSQLEGELFLWISAGTQGYCSFDTIFLKNLRACVWKSLLWYDHVVIIYQSPALKYF